MGRLHPDVEADGIYVTLTNLTHMCTGPVTWCIPGTQPIKIKIDYHDIACVLLYPLDETSSPYVYEFPYLNLDQKEYSLDELNAEREKYAYAVRMAFQEAGLWRRG